MFFFNVKRAIAGVIVAATAAIGLGVSGVTPPTPAAPDAKPPVTNAVGATLNSGGTACLQSGDYLLSGNLA